MKNMDIYKFNSYKEYVNEKVKLMPQRGRGQFRKMAEVLRVHPVYMTQVLRGEKEISFEHGLRLASYLRLNEREKEFFMLLLQHARAGDAELREYCGKRIEEFREKSQELSERLRQKQELTEATRAVFYSSWIYSGVRLLSSVSGFHSPAQIAAYFKLSIEVVQEVVDFLVDAGLCLFEGGELKIGPAVTHLESGSLLVKSRQVQWRAKALERMDHRAPDELFYTGPMALSREARAQIRQELLELIERATKLASESPSEELSCLNIDWFSF